MGPEPHTARSFPPIASPEPRALILGSMPGLKSLEMQQYYAHPQNSFWRIMGLVFDAPVNTYEHRVNLIKDNRLALWDVLKCCRRRGSLDSAIDPATAEVNDFTAFLWRYGGIREIFFNGMKAEAEFRRRALPRLPQDIRARLRLLRMPSTSPANAAIRMDCKLRAWQMVGRAVMDEKSCLESMAKAVVREGPDFNARSGT